MEYMHVHQYITVYNAEPVWGWDSATRVLSATLEMHETKTRFFPQMLVAFYCNFPLKKQASQKAGIIWHSTTRVLRRFLPQLTCLDQVWIAWNAERAWPAHFFRIWLLCGWRLETQIERCEQGCFKRDQVLSQLPSSRCNLHTKASLYNGTSEFGDEFVPQIVEGFFSTKDKPREAWQQKVRRYNAGTRMRFGGLGFRRRHSIFFIKIWDDNKISSWQLVLSVWQRRSSNALSLWPVPVVSLVLVAAILLEPLAASALKAGSVDWSMLKPNIYWRLT